MYCKQLPESCRNYWNVHQYLTLEDDLIVYGCRLLVPSTMCKQVLANLLKAHQGTVWMKQRGRLIVYWLDLDNDLDNLILTCQQCQDHLPSNTKEPIILKERPLQPFQEIPLYAGHDYFITVDCYSDWPDITPMRKAIPLCPRSLQLYNKDSAGP